MTATPLHNAASSRQAFTLIELLVVISIIALLIGILLPALGAARQTARTAQCLSGVRQMAIGANAFAADHKGYFQTATSDTLWIGGGDFDQRIIRLQEGYTGALPSPGRIADWATAAAKYMGEGDFDASGDENTSEVFLCPSDPSREYDRPGYFLWNNISGNTSGGPKFNPVSYGINADFACLVDKGANAGKFDGGPNIFPYDSAKPGNKGLPVQGSFDAAKNGSGTMLFADACTRDPADPDAPVSGAGIIARNVLVYTSANMNGPSLGDFFRRGTFNKKLPIEESDGQQRHNTNGINAVFLDGHATNASGEEAWNDVMISPHGE